MKTEDFLRMLRDDIHTTVMATVDSKRHPVTRVIDVMLVDDRTPYFITAKGKEFYRQLIEQRFVSISGACGGDGMDAREASIHMKAGSAERRPGGYYITDTCTGCQACSAVCPQNCIDTGSVPTRILQEHCLHCGNCMAVCPHGAVRRNGE